jgi:hypothetical protein
MRSPSARPNPEGNPGLRAGLDGDSGAHDGARPPARVREVGQRTEERVVRGGAPHRHHLRPAREDCAARGVEEGRERVSEFWSTGRARIEKFQNLSLHSQTFQNLDLNSQAFQDRRTTTTSFARQSTYRTGLPSMIYVPNIWWKS